MISDGAKSQSIFVCAGYGEPRVAVNSDSEKAHCHRLCQTAASLGEMVKRFFSKHDTNCLLLTVISYEM